MVELAVSGAGRYAIQSVLGRGGMAVVHRATDLHTGTEVALKRLRPIADASRQGKLVELFHQEFRTLARLAHPGVVGVFDFGMDEQGPYYTMELLDGGDLHGLAPLPWMQACALMRDVCSALALLHSRRLLHRDLSPKNVQRTREGRAKLIDFGAMAPMGPCKTVVGTPPFVPPEALLQARLDAAADLYAIGGTLYYALTGRHAYPAQQLSQLRASWRTPPLPPSAHVAGIPPELDRLVLSLLSLEPLARPSSAAEVLDRLSAIAGLARDEQLAVSRAYLSTPELVGRVDQLAQVRRRLGSLCSGEGGVLAIEGAQGMGRSRMLDTCALEAKLARAAVVRAGAAEAAAGPYGVLSALAGQLCDLLDCRSAYESSALALLVDGGITREIDAERRPELQAAFLRLLEDTARVQPVLVAVDDAERCDEPSLAALAAVAVRARDGVLTALSCLSGAGRAGGPMAVLLHDALRVPLPKLSPADTEALLASVFGDAPYLQTVAPRIHERAEGTPRGCMELSQYLLDRGLVRYEMGSWVLPRSLADADLPRTLSAARRERLAALSADARELAEALALGGDAALELDAFAEITSHGDRERVRSALDELVFAQILRSENASYVFEAQLWHGELKAGMDPKLRQLACGRIAAALARRGRDRLEVARYRLQAGETAAAIDGLLEELAGGSRWDRAPRDYDRLLRSALDAARALDRSRRDRIVLLRELVRVEQDLASSDLRAHTLELLAELRRDSGLDDYELPGGPSEPLERLQYVLQLGCRRQESAPAAERGLPQIDAIIALTRLAADTYAIAARTADAALLDIVPALHPFYPFSPVVRLVQELTLPACRAAIAGRFEQACELYRRQLLELTTSDMPGVDPEVREWSVRALHYALGSIEASMGREQALEHAAQIEGSPGWLIPAYSVRQVYYLTLGDLRMAERCRKQIELCELQSPAKPPLAAAAVYQHLFVFAITENPNGFRKAIPELEALAASNPGMLPFVPFARADHARICGNYEDALMWAERARAQARPGEHPLWTWIVSTQLFAMFGQGRYEEGLALGLRELETARRIGIRIAADAIEVPLALIEGKLGRFDSACARLERLIAMRQAERMQGVARAGVHEMRARIAIWMNDTEAFEQHAQLCARQFEQSGGEPALAAKYERLMQEARHHGLTPRSEVCEAMDVQTTIECPLPTTGVRSLRGD